MPEKITPAIKEARNAAQFARDVRGYHARRTPKDSAQRQADLQAARDRLREAMKPLRSYLGRMPRRATTARQAEAAKVRAISAELQAERRKLWKMMQGGPNAH